VILKSLGFECDRSLLETHSIYDSFFVEGLPNVTSTVSQDSLCGTKFIGPSIPGSHMLLLSYFIAGDFDLAASYFSQHPERFSEFLKIPSLTNIGHIANTDYTDLVKLFEKIFFYSGEKDLLARLVEQLVERRKMYDALLPLDKFLEINKSQWDGAVELFALRAGKEKIPYPWNHLLRQE